MTSMESLHPKIQVPVLTSVQQALANLNKIEHEDGSCHYEWLVGSLFTGSETDMLVMHYQCAMYERMLGIKMEARCVYQVERDDDKRQHLLAHTSALHTFDDVSKLVSQQRLHCFRQDVDVVLPWVHTLVAGFPCTTRAKTSRTSHESKGCVQRSEGATGEGFLHVKHLISKTKPLLVVLENVIGLLETPGDSEDESLSDADYICTELRKIGYGCSWFRFNAVEFGSPCVRDRIYLIGCLGISDTKPISNMGHDILRGMKVEPFPISRFIEADVKKVEQITAMLQQPHSVPKGKQSDNASFRDEHFELFKFAGLDWPVRSSKLDREYYRVPAATCDRVVEVILFLDRVFPATSDVEFCDVNKNISWMTGWKMGSTPEEYQRRMQTSPWRAIPLTLVSQSILAVRFRGSHIRILEGWEHMSLIGWSHQNFNPGIPTVSHDCLVSLAGNAFSGFAAHPVFVAGLAMTAGCRTDRGPMPPTGDDDEAMSISDNAGWEDPGASGINIPY